MTYHNPSRHLLFVQDRTDGIFVELQHESVALRAGTDVEVTGVTSAGFAPNVSEASIRVLGLANLPAPKTKSFESAIQGREDCRWLELGGIVQHIASGAGDSLLTLALGPNTYEAHVPASPQALKYLIDAEVQLRGACGAMFNSRNQLLGIRMFVPGIEYIRVLSAATPDPFALPPTPIADLLRFSNGKRLGHRVRLRGIVTYPGRSGPAWVQDLSGGIMLQDHDGGELTAGDLVDVAGFPAIAGFGPGLHGAEVKRLRSGVQPGPARITIQEAMSGDFDAQLVQVEGSLVDWLQRPVQALVMKAGQAVFYADIPSGMALPALTPGTQLRLTGICSVEVAQSHDSVWPNSFRLLLRSPADVKVVGRSPWFTAGHVVPILAGAILAMFAAIAWVGLLRRRVHTQTRALQAQTIQLQTAHQRISEALEKAREAESLDEDRSRIVELIARDEPVELIVDHIAEAVALHCEGAVCAILLASPEGHRICMVPDQPAEWLNVLRSIDIRSISFSLERRSCRDFSDHRAWADFTALPHSSRFRTYCSAPIVVHSATVGTIATFFRSEEDAADTASAQLGLWCNIVALALERRRLHDQLAYRAQHDSLTGLPNRAMLEEKLEAEMDQASAQRALLAILYIDLDGFKQINDTYGHDVGDEVLREVAKRMTQGRRRGDTVARIGGDEFVVLLPLLARREDAAPIADKIANMLSRPMYLDQKQLSISACIGTAIWPIDGDRSDALLRFADAQMYATKRQRQLEQMARSTILG